MADTEHDGLDELMQFRVALGRRIAAAIAKYPTKSAASVAAGVTVEQLNHWVRGASKVPAEGLWRLVKGDAAEFIRLCAGESDAVPMRPAGRVIQEPALRDVLAALAEVAASDGIAFAPDKYADLVMTLHDYVVEQRARAGGDADLSALGNVIRFAAQARR